MLSASDLRESQRRLESRAREASERAKQKAEKERILAERQAARQAAREEEARQRRLAQLAAEEEVGAAPRGRCSGGWLTSSNTSSACSIARGASPAQLRRRGQHFATMCTIMLCAQ